MESVLTPLISPGSAVIPDEGQGFRLSNPAGTANRYCVAQLDDYNRRSRRNYPHHAPLKFRLEARIYSANHRGTWGFGLWNAPFSFGIGHGGGAVLPALPNAAWFFHASPENYLSFRNDRPGNGFLAQTFQSSRYPGLLYTPLAPLALLLPLRSTARILRGLIRRILVRDDGLLLADLDPEEWHEYEISWTTGQVMFFVDGSPVFDSPFAPRGPLGFVIWIDNQFAAFEPDGRLGYGLLDNPDLAWLDIRALSLG